MKHLPTRLASKRQKPRGKSLIRKRRIRLPRGKTSVALEDAFWESLKEIAAARNMSRPALVQEINKKRQHANLSSAIRVFVLEYYRERTR
jgi:predicted DNA-binding ribbon-helix-helix protein